jgi:hypothetical protein
VNDAVSPERLVCRALGCNQGVFIDFRCKIHYERFCERALLAEAAAERAAAAANRRCSVDGCTRQPWRRNLCQSHYGREKAGDSSPVRQWGTNRQASA